MSKKIEGKVAAVSQPGNMEAHGSITISGRAELSASVSMTDAIVSVTSNSMRAEMDAFWEQFDELTPIDQKLLAEGMTTAKDMGIKTTLPQPTTKGMAQIRRLDDELKERREHDKELAQINASGPAKAEIVKWALWIVGAVILALVSWYLGTTTD